MFKSFPWLSADAAAAGPTLRPFVLMRNAMSAGPDELLNDCHFSFYFKWPCVMASYRHSVYLRPLPYATFIYGPEYKLERGKKWRKKRSSLVFSQLDRLFFYSVNSKQGSHGVCSLKAHYCLISVLKLRGRCMK